MDLRYSHGDIQKHREKAAAVVTQYKAKTKSGIRKDFFDVVGIHKLIVLNAVMLLIVGCDDRQAFEGFFSGNPLLINLCC